MTIQLRELEIEAFERYGEPVGIFTVNTVPDGPAPECIKEDWLDLPLVVRRDLLEEHTDDDETMPIASEDAIIALATAKKFGTATYWLNASILMMGYLRFQRQEGIYRPIDYVNGG